MLFFKVKYRPLFIALFLIGFTLSSNKLIAQEKKDFLQSRYDGFGEVITKKSTRAELKSIKHKLERQGVYFSYNKLKYNKKKEILRITIHLKNKRSQFSSKWNHKNIPIPNIRIGETNGMVSAKPIFTDKKTHPLYIKNNNY